MGYTFTCDACGSNYGQAPPFMGEFRESWIKTSDSPIAESELYRPGQTVTVCRECAEDIFPW